MLRKWTWILPCWFWRWAFKTSGKMLVSLGDKRVECIRIDDEFLLVRSPVIGWKPKGDPDRKYHEQQEKLKRKRSKLRRKVEALNYKIDGFDEVEMDEDED